MKKILIDGEPFGGNDQRTIWTERGIWPASWISGAGDRNDLSVAYRNIIELDEPATVRFHITADAVYRLFIDGRFCGMGPESGDADNWFFDTWEVELSSGRHAVVALVLSYGELAPVAQISVRHGLLFAAEGRYGDLLNTGRGNWQCRELDGLTVQKSPYWIFGYMGGATRFDAREYPAGVEAGAGDGWDVPVTLYPAANAESSNEYRWPYLLRPATLPEKIDRPVSGWLVCQVAAGTEIFWDPEDNLETERFCWQTLAAGVPVTVPSGTQVRCLISLPDYCCAYPYLTVSGGRDAILSLSWAEALFRENRQDGDKGDRAEWRNRYFIGLADTFISSGAEKQQFFVHRWKSGCYLMLTVETGETPIVIDALVLRETRYPLEMQSGFNTSDGPLNRLIKPCLRTLQMCMHDTFMDCPYYEQLMYIGDTRLQMLLTYVLSCDTRPAEKALRMFAAGRHPSGLLLSRYPSRIPQIIPGFSLLWIGMLHDFSLWRCRPQLVSELLPTAKGIVDAFERYRNSDGLFENIRSWNFVDWADGWDQGIPPDGENDVSGILNWMWCGAVRELSELCELCCQPGPAQYYRRMAEEMAHTLIARLWNEQRGLFADTFAHDVFSEHAQCLAVVSGLLPERYRQRLRLTLGSDSGLTQTTIYFSHYWFEACRLLNLDRCFFARLQNWFDLESSHLKTLPERPEPSRSDCHAWSAHPLYHYFATMLGIRPAAPGFTAVTVSPLPGSLSWVKAALPHPAGGMIEAEYSRTEAGLRIMVTLPPALSGILSYNGHQWPLSPGRSREIFPEKNLSLCETV